MFTKPQYLLHGPHSVQVLQKLGSRSTKHEQDVVDSAQPPSWQNSTHGPQSLSQVLQKSVSRSTKQEHDVGARSQSAPITSVVTSAVTSAVISVVIVLFTKPQ